MKQKFIRFMQGRYGADELTRFLTVVMLIFWLLSVVISVFAVHSFQMRLLVTVFNCISWIAIILSIYRMFSRNISRRYAENQAYLRIKNKILKYIKLRKTDKDHKIYFCPKCKQMIRVPKGKGKIAIRCPKCGTEFIKRT